MQFLTHLKIHWKTNKQSTKTTTMSMMMASIKNPSTLTKKKNSFKRLSMMTARVMFYVECCCIIYRLTFLRVWKTQICTVSSFLLNVAVMFWIFRKKKTNKIEYWLSWDARGENSSIISFLNYFQTFFTYFKFF